MNLLYLLIRTLLFLLLFPYASSVSFEIQQFNATANNIIYEGDAEPVDGVVELTNKVHYVGRVGRATYAERVPLWDSHKRRFSDFHTNFSFLIDKKGQGTYGSGFAFYLARWGYPIPPNSGAGFLGLFNKTTIGDTPENQVVLVEFDYYVDDEWDPACQHIGININSISSVVCKPWNVNLHNGEITEVSIDYNATTKNQSVHWSYKNHHHADLGEATSLSYLIDLAKILPEWVSVGFSAGTNQYGERHKILSWQFYSSLEGVSPPNKILIEVIKILDILIFAGLGLKTAELWWRWLRKKIRNRRGAISGLIPADLSDLSSTFEETEAGSSRRRVSDHNVATESFSNGESTIVDVDTAMWTTEMNRITSFRHQNLVQLRGRGQEAQDGVPTVLRQ